MEHVGSTQELANVLGVDYTVANSVLRFLKDKGVVKEVGTRPAKGGKGKPATLYALPTSITLSFPAPAVAEVA